MSQATIKQWRQWWERSMAGNPDPQSFEEFRSEQVAAGKSPDDPTKQEVGALRSWLKKNGIEGDPVERRFIAAIVKDAEGVRWRECQQLSPEVFEGLNNRRAWHDIIRADSYEAAALAAPSYLEAGDKLCLASGSKSFKTWSLIQLCMAISNGVEWLGFVTHKRKVLFLNFELKPRNVWKRAYRVRRPPLG